MARAKITKRFVDSLSPVDGTRFHFDTELRGFGIRQTASGFASYIFEYRPGGGGRRSPKRRLTIGSVSSLAPDEARRVARKLQADVAHGKDPQAERQARRRELKVGELIDLWDRQNPPGRRSGEPMAARTKAYTLGRLRNHVLPLIGAKRVSEVSVAVVNDVLKRVTNGETARRAPSERKRGRIVAKGGAGAALKVASDLSIILAYAVELGILPANPVSGARKPKAGKRHSYLTAEQVAAIAKALSEMEAAGTNKAGLDLIRLLLLTGARPSEIESLRWEEVDLENACLRLSKTKTGYSRRPLSRQAIELIKAQPQTDSPYVFPATRGEGNFVGSKKLWNEARTRAKLPHVVRYDARHMVATLALSSGHDIAAVSALMGHAGPRTTLAVYAHVLDNNSTRAADDVADKVAATMALPSIDESACTDEEAA